MSFIRPEARATIWRWREALCGAGLLLLGFWWMSGPGGLLGWVGGGLCLAGLALLLIGTQRARFRSGAGGPGVVQVDEGQITYFGPLSGGTVAVPDLRRLTLDATGRPAHWALEQSGQPPLFIPVNAEGADALFDVFAALPGMRTQRMLNELQRRRAHQVVIWQHPTQTDEAKRLH